MKIRFLYVLLLSVILASCGEYDKVLKSTDNELKYAYAKKCFDAQKYDKSATIFESLLPIYKGTSKEEEALYLLAQSNFKLKEYMTATQYYKVYYNEFPKGQYAEIAHFNAAYGLYLDSPDARLDQSNTYKAIEEFQVFTEAYPESEKTKIAQNCMFELQEKLAYKEFLAAKLYYNLGDYMGNNYESCVVTSHEALKHYLFSKYAEDFQILILRSRYQLALKSIDSKKPIRFRDVKDEYFNYKNTYPQGKYLKEAERYYHRALKELGENELGEIINNKPMSSKERKEAEKSAKKEAKEALKQAKKDDMQIMDTK